MSAGYDAVYEPIAENVEIYNKLFEEYLRLQEYFGGGENDVMKRLIKLSAKY
jgi:L-ribulokinase